MKTFLPTALVLAMYASPLYAGNSLNPNTLDEIKQLIQKRQLPDDAGDSVVDTSPKQTDDKTTQKNIDSANETQVARITEELAGSFVDVENSDASQNDLGPDSSDPIAVYLSIHDREADQFPEPTAEQRQAYLKRTFERIEQLFDAAKTKVKP